MITYFLISIFLWFFQMVDSMLLNFGFLRESAIYVNIALNYLDLIVLYLRAIFPFTVSAIFGFLWNMFTLLIFFLFVQKVKSFIPFLRK